MNNIMESYLDKLQIESIAIIEYGKLIYPCNRHWQKKIKIIKKLVLGALVGHVPGIIYVAWFTKSGILQNLAEIKCSITALKKLIKKYQNTDKKKLNKFKKMLINDEKILKKRIKRAEDKMKKLKTKGNEKAYKFMKNHYDEIIKI